MSSRYERKAGRVYDNVYSAYVEPGTLEWREYQAWLADGEKLGKGQRPPKHKSKGKHK